MIREGQVLLSAVRVALTQDKSAYIQTLIRERSASGDAGGPCVYPVPTDTKLASVFSISASGGIYKLDTPVTISVQLQGKPAMSVVGKPMPTK